MMRNQRGFAGADVLMLWAACFFVGWAVTGYIRSGGNESWEGRETVQETIERVSDDARKAHRDAVQVYSDAPRALGSRELVQQCRVIPCSAERARHADKQYPMDGTNEDCVLCHGRHPYATDNHMTK